MAIKKSELYSSLWKSCDELRGGMDASQYKDYILVLLFVKYVSDRYTGDKNALIDIPEGGSFADMAALKGDKEIGDKLNVIIGRLAEANDLKGVIDLADFNDPEKLGKGKEMVDRLTNLVAIFSRPEMNFSGNSAQGDDILGDAYEYLMRHFATESGKSKGQFYTPAEVSRVMAQVLGLAKASGNHQSIYDPTCGSGSLLLKAHDEARAHTGFDLALYGQEMDNATSGLARMNMILHDCPTAEIWKDNTIAAPHFKEADGRLKQFDFAVANPPFSTKAWSNGIDPLHDPYGRFEYGIPPEKNGDYAFLLHILTSLKSSGKGAVILPHGVLFRGGAEGSIREKLIRQGVIKGIIGLPANLFYGTGIPACIIVLDKEDAVARKGIFMLDASRGFIKDGNKNRLREQDIHRIVDVFGWQREIPRYARMVGFAELEANDFNLNLPRYIDGSAPEDLQDIDAHLKGGIPDVDLDALSAYWDVFPAVRSALFAPARPGYSQLSLDIAGIKPAIFGHAEFVTFKDSVHQAFALWVKRNRIHLEAIVPGTKPRELAKLLGEDVLSCFKPVALVDRYDVYQQLMDYWDATLKDDVYQIVAEGWHGVLDGQPNTDLIPLELVVARFFADDARAIEALQAQCDEAGRALEELVEEHESEDSLLNDARTDKGKLSAKSVKDRLKAIKGDPSAGEEAVLLAKVLALIEAEAAAAKRVKDAQKLLDNKARTRYATLSPAEIETLVIDDKWLAALAAGVEQELERVSQALTHRLKELAERYAKPLPALQDEVALLGARVDAHLKAMGFTW